jgi:hypothetical protein
MEYREIIESKYAEAVKGIKGEWFTDTNEEWYAYIVSLPDPLQFTYLIVVLNNQVLNGGFHQYFVNGYGQFAQKTIIALEAIGASQKAGLLNAALEIVNLYSDDDNVFRKKLLQKNIPELFIEDDLFEPLDQLDTAYYENEEDIVSLLGKYLS